jgi:type I restriction enzyme S subunit
VNRESAIPVEEFVEELAPKRRFQPYPEYRDSGIDWLGPRPSHWNVRKLKHIASLRTSNVDKKSHEEEQPVRLCNYTDVYYNEQIVANLAFMEATASPEEIAKFSLVKGDVLITKDSEDPNDIAVPACVVDALGRVLCGYHLAQVRAHPGLAHGPYLARAFKASGIRDQFNSRATGITRHGLSKDTIGSSLFLIPPLDEQRAIAAFLDRETARIDELIAKKQRLIELLAEKRTALISHAVTKGLNPDAPMKDSGIPWLGETPLYWNIERLKFRYRRIEQGWSPQCENRTTEPGEWGVLKVGCMNTENYNESENKALPANLDPIPHYEINVGDLLMSRSNTVELVGSVGRVHATQGRIMLCDKLYRIALDPRKLGLEYAVHLLRSRAARLQIERDATGASASMKNISNDRVGNLVLAFPDLSEQARIVTYLDVACRKTSQVASAIRSAVDTLREYRSALISAAVTGKIDVRSVKFERSGLAKRLINAGEYLFLKKDAESALTPICNAVDRAAKDIYGRAGRSTYERFIHDRMELITRVAFHGTGVLNLLLGVAPIPDGKGGTVKPKETLNGVALYSFEQIVYHLVRCKLDHECEIPTVFRDGADKHGQVHVDTEGNLQMSFDAIAHGLLFAVLSEVDLWGELVGTIYEHVEWKGVPLIDLVGQKRRMAELAKAPDPTD